MTEEEFQQSLRMIMQNFGGTAERVPPKKESSGPPAPGTEGSGSCLPDAQKGGDHESIGT